MVNSDILKSYFVRNGYSVPQAARKLGMPTSTMYHKLRTGIFTSSELEDMKEIFGVSYDEILK